jgi:hypothetical protein
MVIAQAISIPMTRLDNCKPFFHQEEMNMSPEFLPSCKIKKAPAQEHVNDYQSLGRKPHMFIVTALDVIVGGTTQTTSHTSNSYLSPSSTVISFQVQIMHYSSHVSPVMVSIH